MPATKRKSNSSAALIGGAAAAVLLLLGAGFFILRSGDPNAKLPAFPVEAYLENSGLWSNEDYRLGGRIDNILAQSNDNKYVLVSLQPEEGEERLPVLLLKENGRIPVERDEEVSLRVRLGTSREIMAVE